jgi:hypothetical protein
MFRKASLAAGLLLAIPAAHATLLLTGAGSKGGSAVVAYSAGGVWYDGVDGNTAANHAPSYKRTSALTGVSDGAKGIVSFWTMCQEVKVDAATPQCVGTDLMTNLSMLTSGNSSEAVKGMNIVMDTANVTLGSGYGTMRLNLNSSTEPFGSAPQFGMVASNAMTPSDYGHPIHWLFVWDHSGSTHCGQIYKNGVSTSAAPGTTGAFVANVSNATGFAIGNNETYQGSAGYPSALFNGMLSEVYVNFAPQNTPCVSNAIANYSISKFYNAGAPVDLGTNCNNPTITDTVPTPAICLRWNTAGVTTGNEGSGGTFTSDYPAGLSAAPIGPGQSPSGPYLKYITYNDPGATNSATPSLQHYTPVAGDLIVVSSIATFTTQATTNSITLSTANGFAAFGTAKGTSSSFETMNQFYKIATGTDPMPTLALSSTGTRRSWPSIVAVYGNVNQTTPFGGVGVWTDSGPSGTTSAFPCIFPTTANGAKTPLFSGSTIATLGFSYGNSQATLTMAQAGSQRRYWSSDHVHTGAPAFFLHDYINSGLTAVPDATVTVGPSADDDGCFMFEIQHP